jgi:hypothetical protein
MKKLLPIVTAALLASFTLTSCETSGQSTLAGAAAGAAIGGAATGRGSGAFHGAAIGAAGGYLLGKLVQADRRRYDRDRYDDRDRYEDRDYDRREPVARLTDRRGFVRSPYAPNNLIDVRGIPSGARVEDPSVGRVFINP